MNRRQWLLQAGAGFGGLALMHLLAQDSALGGAIRPEWKRRSASRAEGQARRAAVHERRRQPDGHVRLQAELAKRHGEKVDFGIKTAATSEVGAIMKSPFEFKQHGQCGRWVSSVFPHMAECVDDLAFLMAMASKTNVHGPASYMQNTGFLRPGFPCLGAWMSYGLGNLNDNLPTFVVLPDPRGLPYNATGNFSQGFLPAAHQGTVINPNAEIPIANLHPPESAKHVTHESEAGRARTAASSSTPSISPSIRAIRGFEARMASYELGAKLQLSAPQVFDLSDETAATLADYGVERRADATALAGTA